MSKKRNARIPSKRRKSTALEMSAVDFVALLAQNVDEQRGIVTENGTPETQSKVIAIVNGAFFKDQEAGANP